MYTDLFYQQCPGAPVGKWEVLLEFTLAFVHYFMQIMLLILCMQELSHRAMNKIADIVQPFFFQMPSFHNEKLWYFDSNFTNICSSGSNWHYITITLPNHYLNQWLLRFMIPYGITKTQWVKPIVPCQFIAFSPDLPSTHHFDQWRGSLWVRLFPGAPFTNMVWLKSRHG